MFPRGGPCGRRSRCAAKAGRLLVAAGIERPAKHDASPPLRDLSPEAIARTPGKAHSQPTGHAPEAHRRATTSGGGSCEGDGARQFHIVEPRRSDSHEIANSWNAGCGILLAIPRHPIQTVPVYQEFMFHIMERRIREHDEAGGLRARIAPTGPMALRLSSLPDDRAKRATPPGATRKRTTVDRDPTGHAP